MQRISRLSHVCLEPSQSPTDEVVIAQLHVLLDFVEPRLDPREVETLSSFSRVLDRTAEDRRIVARQRDHRAGLPTPLALLSGRLLLTGSRGVRWRDQQRGEFLLIGRRGHLSQLFVQLLQSSVVFTLNFLAIGAKLA